MNGNGELTETETGTLFFT